MTLGCIEKVGSIGSFIAALACLACFPILAVVGASLGLGVLQPFEGVVFLVFRILVLLALVGNVLVYLNHKSLLPLSVGVASPLAIFFAIYIHWNPIVLYTGLTGLLASSVLNYMANRRCPSCKPEERNMIPRSIITCPHGGRQKEETMPTDACLYSYKCTQCGDVLKRKDGDCCVFCSYGSVPCPPI